MFWWFLWYAINEGYVYITRSVLKSLTVVTYLGKFPSKEWSKMGRYWWGNWQSWCNVFNPTILIATKLFHIIRKYGFENSGIMLEAFRSCVHTLWKLSFISFISFIYWAVHASLRQMLTRPRQQGLGFIWHNFLFFISIKN